MALFSRILNTAMSFILLLHLLLLYALLPQALRVPRLLSPAHVVSLQGEWPQVQMHVDITLDGEPLPIPPEIEREALDTLPVKFSVENQLASNLHDMMDDEVMGNVTLDGEPLPTPREIEREVLDSLHDMLDDEAMGNVLPWDIDVLLTDVTSSHLHGVISRALGHHYLSTRALTQPPVWPLRGIVFGRHRRLMVSTFVTLSPKKAKANDVKAKMVVLHFLVDTGSPYTYLAEEAVRMLADGPFYYDVYGTLPVVINGVSLHAYISPPHKGFHDVNLMGADFFEAIEGDLRVSYGGAESFTLSKGS